MIAINICIYQAVEWNALWQGAGHLLQKGENTSKEELLAWLKPVRGKLLLTGTWSSNAYTPGMSAIFSEAISSTEVSSRSLVTSSVRQQERVGLVVIANCFKQQASCLHRQNKTEQSISPHLAQKTKTLIVENKKRRLGQKAERPVSHQKVP